MKRIYMEPAWKMHSFYKAMMDNPPLGYEFVTIKSSQEKLFKAASKINFSYSVLNGIDKIVPVNLAKSYLGRFRKMPSNLDLTYSFDHLIFRKEPWVVDLEYVALLVSYNVRNFRRYKGFVQRVLESECCKKIICGTEAAKKTVLLNLNSDKLDAKIETIPFATRKKNFTKQFNRTKIKILFVGSANIVGSLI